MEGSEPARLDAVLATQHPDITRSQVSKLIASGKVTVNGQKITKAGYKVSNQDKLVIDLPKKQNHADVRLDVLYENNDVIVLDKPTGILTHTKGEYNPEPTVASWLAIYLKKSQGANNRDGIVHRLDRGTSGVIITAKNEASLKYLQKQFSTRKVKKTYIAVIKGELQPPEALIDLPIERNPKRPQTFRVGANGKPARTTYKVLSSANDYSLLELRPETGRTHQLRVHLAHLGHPIVGDDLYCGEQADRLYLHAQSLEITLPDQSRQIFTSKLPSSFKNILK